MAKKVQKKPYVRYSTIWKSVGGGFSNPGQSKLVKVGKYRVLLERKKRLDSYGNPVHTAYVVDRNGGVSGSYTSNGSAANVVSNALKRSGVETKYSRYK